MPDAQKDVESYLAEVEKLEQAKQGIIEKLLAERNNIDEQLQKLGYGKARKGGGQRAVRMPKNEPLKRAQLVNQNR